MALVLASKSAARVAMLKNAAVEFSSIPADLDEEKIIAALENQGASATNISRRLSEEKALKISKEKPEDYIIGSDQVLSMDEKIYSKAIDYKQAKERLLEFQGKEHYLTSGVCVVKGGNIIWHKTDAAALKMKPMSQQDIDNYSEIANDDLLNCVGCYAIEGAGIRLFDDIRGDFFTIMGMPLLPLLRFLESEGVIS